MEKIKVEDVLKKFGWYEKMDVHSRMYVKAAIKEIVELALDRAKKKATTTISHCTHSSGQYCECEREVDKDSIEAIKKEDIDYD